MTIYYFDANALWKFYKDEQGSINIRRLVSNSSDPIIISSLTGIEFVGILMKYFRQGYLKCREIRKLAERYRRDITIQDNQRRPFRMVDTSVKVFRAAENILLKNAAKSNIGSKDGLHLAIMLELQNVYPEIIMVTSDSSMQAVCERISLAYYDPETDQTN